MATIPSPRPGASPGARPGSHRLDVGASPAWGWPVAVWVGLVVVGLVALVALVPM